MTPVRGIYPPNGHSWAGYCSGDLPVRRRRFDPDEAGFGPWEDAGAVNIGDLIGDWQSDESNDYIFVCHSQGCNNLMFSLEAGCGK